MTDALASAPRTSALRRVLATRFPMFKDGLTRALASFGDPWLIELERTLSLLLPTDDAVERAAAGYASFALDTLRRERRFEVEGTYPAMSFAEAASSVYLDHAYMTDEYLPGLLLSHYLWPHHYRQSRFFDASFVAELAVAGVTEVAEVGCGTGLYSRRLLEQLPGALAHGYDLSPSSAAFAASHVAAFGAAERYATSVRDVVAEGIPATEALVCVEVLEHLEDPMTLLEALRTALTPGGRGFLTAAINAPHVDHIYLYRSPDEVALQVSAAGFVIEQAFVGFAYPPRRPGLPVPTVAAYVVR